MHARNGHISTSGLKSDITIVFLDLDFLQDAENLAIKLLLYGVFFIAHARNGRIFTSGLKSDVTVVFLDPDFLSDVLIMEIRP